MQLLAYRGEPKYKGHINLGDAIQTVALKRLISAPVTYVYRHDLAKADGSKFIVNGYLCDKIPTPAPRALFCGVHLGEQIEEQIRWLRTSERPIGARDPYTHQQLHTRGILSEFIGCATMTLERYSGPRQGRYAIDAEGDKDCIKLSQDFPNITWNEQLCLADERLNTIRTAQLVFTNRLHIAIPCLAFGTPVVISKPTFHVERFTLLSWLGIKFDIPQLFDLHQYTQKFLDFLNVLMK